MRIAVLVRAAGPSSTPWSSRAPGGGGGGRPAVWCAGHGGGRRGRGTVLERTSSRPGLRPEAYTARWPKPSRSTTIDLVAMAGFGHRSSTRRCTTPSAAGSSTPIRRCCPPFQGWHAVRDALAAGVKVTGCTVHLAALEVDTGPILAQEAVPVLPTTPRRRCTSGSRRSSAGSTRPPSEHHRSKARRQCRDAERCCRCTTRPAWSSSPRAWPTSGGSWCRAAAPPRRWREAGLDVTDIGRASPASPAILGHRVITLHPKIHGGILADRDRPRAPGRHGGARHRAASTSWWQPLPVRLDLGLRPWRHRRGPDRHRRPGHGAGRGQEPRPRRRGRRPGATTPACSTSCAPTARCRRRHPAPAGPGRLRPHGGLRRGRSSRWLDAADEPCRRRPTASDVADLARRAHRDSLRYGENPHQRGRAATAPAAPTRGGTPSTSTAAWRSATSTSTTPTPPGGSCTTWRPSTRRPAGGRHHQARQPVRRRGGRHAGRPPTSGRSSATRGPPSAASWP